MNSEIELELAKDLWATFGPELLRELINHYKNNRLLGEAIYHSTQINYSFSPRIKLNLRDYTMIWEANKSINWEKVAVFVKGFALSYKKVAQN